MINLTLLKSFRPFFLLAVFMLISGCSNGESNSAEGESNNGSSTVYDGDGSHEQRDALWNSLQESQRKAEQNGKWVLVDVYTEWCGYCRQMYQETYTDEKVLDNLNEYFHVTRINAESDENIRFNGQEMSMEQFAAEFGVTSYPTTIIIDSDGEPFAVQPGFIEADEFADILTYVGTEAYEEVSFDEYSGN